MFSIANQTRTQSARGIFPTRNSNQISRYGDCNKLYVFRFFDQWQKSNEC